MRVYIYLCIHNYEYTYYMHFSQGIETILLIESLDWCASLIRCGTA